jgi:broad specificity phosphatase PhoE
MSASKASKLLVVRHGQTDDNARGIFQGQDGAALNDKGKEQARKLGARLATGTRPPFTIHSSDLARARETAEIVGLAVRATPTMDPDLREMLLGAWQGLTFAQIASRFPDEWAAWRGGDTELRRGGGETYAELAARMTRAMHRIADSCEGRAAIVVSHGAAIKTFVGVVLGTVPGTPVWLRALGVPGNTSVTLIERDEDRMFRLVTWSDSTHLADGVLAAI